MVQTKKMRAAQWKRRIPVVSIAPNGERTRYASMVEAAGAIHASVAQISRASNFGYTVHGMKWERDDADG